MVSSILIKVIIPGSYKNYFNICRVYSAGHNAVCRWNDTPVFVLDVFLEKQLAYDW